MERAVVLIGVSKIRGLPELSAVGEGIRQMKRWAESQGIGGDYLIVLCDEISGEVRAHQVSDAIAELVGRGTVGQLIVYFAGHGIHNRGERWLLSRAPISTGEAVNVEGSIQLARYCGIPHVVLISDACRTAPDGIQATQVTGTEIFPNDVTCDFEQKVDVFFACSRGNAAYEIRNVTESAERYGAIYSEALVECLRGMHGGIIEPETDETSRTGVIRADRLHEQLKCLVPARLEKRFGPLNQLNQIPDARIVSRKEWLSKVPLQLRMRGHGASLSPRPSPADVIEKMISGTVTSERVQKYLLPPPLPWSVEMSSFRSCFQRRLMERDTPFKIQGCSFEVLGEELRSVAVPSTATATMHPSKLAATIKTDEPVVNVLLRFSSGAVTVLPTIAGLQTRLVFEPGHPTGAGTSLLVDVSYQLVGGRDAGCEKAWDFGLDDLRSAISAAANDGQLRLNESVLDALTDYVCTPSNEDIGLALYCAYCCHEAQRSDLIRRLAGMVEIRFGARLFDLNLLGWGGAPSVPLRITHGSPGLPLLSQGWALLPAFRTCIPEALLSLERYLLPSLWTLFEARAHDPIYTAMIQGELQ